MSPSRSARASHAAAVPKSAAPRRRVSVKLFSWTSLRWSRTVRSPLRLASRVCEVPPRSACDGVAARALTRHLVALALASQLVRPNLLLPSFQSIVHTDARNTFLCDSYELATPHQRLCPKSNFLLCPSTWWTPPHPSDLSLHVTSAGMPSLAAPTHPSCQSSWSVLHGTRLVLNGAPVWLPVSPSRLCPPRRQTVFLVHHCIPTAWDGALYVSKKYLFGK